MLNLRRLPGRLPIDPYLLMLIATVALAVALPAQGAFRPIVDKSVYGAIAALFFLYGARLSPQAVWAGMSNWRLQFVVFASTFALFPLVGIATMTAIGSSMPRDLVIGILFLTLLPSTVQSSIAFTSIARGNVPAALCSASLSNLAGIMMTPLLVSLLLPSAGAGISAHALEGISLQILLPFAVGQIARLRIGDWLRRHPLLTSAVDRGSILLVVYAAFSAGMAAGVWQLVSAVDLLAVLAIDAAMLGVVILATTVASRLFRFSREDEIAIVFCGSKKSMASGISMASILLPGHSVSLIVLPLMLFHQIQLFVCAMLARRYAKRSAGSPVGSPPPIGCRGGLRCPGRSGPSTG